MAMSRLQLYLNRSSRILRDNTVKSKISSQRRFIYETDTNIPPVLRMEGVNPPDRSPKPLYTLNSREDLLEYATGCDADIGGTSTVHLDLEEDPSINRAIGKPASAKFWGEMRLRVRPELEGKIRGGYAGFRNKVCPSLGTGVSTVLMNDLE